MSSSHSPFPVEILLAEKMLEISDRVLVDFRNHLSNHSELLFAIQCLQFKMFVSKDIRFADAVLDAIPKRKKGRKQILDQDEHRYNIESTSKLTTVKRHIYMHLHPV